ncbi:hypothetical protein N825_22955 [Skermanella stibiiresistens SB22]|uniref:HTH tetR-type domain-containing protein n=1 Tax=Skermanella stibiiresistens SB22 TaxID=1385369 RepID=W9GSV6_9PROT|nr:hypothetical protein N825_22955 [Skermanella stibiiresistens SB22]
MALAVLHEEGADRLSLGHLAARAGVSKPIPYEHFGTRSGLLIEPCKELDGRQVTALRDALRSVRTNSVDTADVLATAYIHCSADTGGECALMIGGHRREKEAAEAFSALIQGGLIRAA